MLTGKAGDTQIIQGYQKDAVDCAEKALEELVCVIVSTYGKPKSVLLLLNYATKNILLESQSHE